MAIQNWDWVFLTLGWGLAGLGVLLALWALFWDRSRGRRRCPKCWYSMEGAAKGEDGSMTCPECGRSPRTARSLLRTRRRRKWACLAITLIVGAWPLGSYPEISRAGWLGLLPTRAVIELLPLGGMEGPFGKDLERRLGFAPDRFGKKEVSISHSEQLYLIRRVTQGNVLARPIGERWRASYGELHTRDMRRMFTFGSYTKSTEYLDGEPADDALKEAMIGMLDIPVEVRVRTRRGWPAGVPIMIEVGVDRWYPAGASGTMKMKWTTPDGSQSGEVQQFAWNIGVPSIHPTESMPEPTIEIEITQMPTIWPWDKNEPIEWETTRHTLSWVIVDSIDDVMTAVRSPQLDAHLVQTLNPTWDGAAEYLRLHLDANRLDPTIVRSISFGMRGELWHNDKSVGTISVRWVGDTKPLVPGGRGLSMIMMQQIDQEYIEEHKGEGKWTLTLKPDHSWAIRNLDADKYWDGEITIPLTIK